MTTRLMRHTEGQKTLLSSLKQNFSPEVPESEEAFANFEKTFEGLVTADNENKKSVLDQVRFRSHEVTNIILITTRRCFESF